MDEVNGGDRPAPGAGRRIRSLGRRPGTADPGAPPPPAPAPREPADAAEPVAAPRRFDLAAFRLGALGLALVLTISITMVRLFVGGPPSVSELRARAGVDSWTVLDIGVKDDQPGVAYYDARRHTWSGFDIDIAYMLAEDLGFRRDEVRFYAIESEDRARMQAVDPANHRVPVRLVVASYSITPDRRAMTGVNFSAPYLYTEQSVLTLAGHAKVATFNDLSGKAVCSLSTSTSQSAAERAGVQTRSRNRISECVSDLRRGEVDAITTDAAILAGFKATHPAEFDHFDLGLDATEAWGVNVGENKALQKLVDLTLYRSLTDPRDGRWELAYERNLRVEEAANDRTPIAQAQQPGVPKPDVRELPWEDVVP